jgi:hypothetical protein
MAANAAEMKKVLATAIFDQGFRSELMADPVAAASTLDINLDNKQTTMLRQIGERLSNVESSAFEAFKITTSRNLDHMGNPTGPIAFHASSSISW